MTARMRKVWICVSRTKEFHKIVFYEIYLRCYTVMCLEAAGELHQVGTETEASTLAGS